MDVDTFFSFHSDNPLLYILLLSDPMAVGVLKFPFFVPLFWVSFSSTSGLPSSFLHLALIPYQDGPLVFSSRLSFFEPSHAPVFFVLLLSSELSHFVSFWYQLATLFPTFFVLLLLHDPRFDLSLILLFPFELSDSFFSLSDFPSSFVPSLVPFS